MQGSCRAQVSLPAPKKSVSVSPGSLRHRYRACFSFSLLLPTRLSWMLHACSPLFLEHISSLYHHPGRGTSDVFASVWVQPHLLPPLEWDMAHDRLGAAPQQGGTKGAPLIASPNKIATRCFGSQVRKVRSIALIPTSQGRSLCLWHWGYFPDQGSWDRDWFTCFPIFTPSLWPSQNLLRAQRTSPAAPGLCFIRQAAAGGQSLGYGPVSAFCAGGFSSNTGSLGLPTCHQVNYVLVF